LSASGAIGSGGARLAALPREPLAVLPTPLEPAPRLSEQIGVQVLVKRDDLTGVGAGGNKVRPLEYLLGDALSQGADAVVTGSGPHSNHAALTALCAARCGLRSHLVRYGEQRELALEGNVALAAFAGAETNWTGKPARSSVDPAIQDRAAALRDEGARPYVIPRGGATPLGCAGYVRASLELAEQLVALGVTPSRVVVATGSCGTQAGLVLGARWLQAPYRVVGVTVSRPVSECVERVRELCLGCAELLGLALPGWDPQPEIVGGYMGDGYGVPTAAGRAATELVARTEGLLLDPVFTSKAVAALVDHADEDPGPVVFWHTGGAPTALLASMLEIGGAL
jgi:D-cysteine desulfhydrase